MFHGVMAMASHKLNWLSIPLGNISRTGTNYKTRLNPSMIIQVSSIAVQTEESGNSSESKKISCSITALTRCQTTYSLLSQDNTVGIIGGVSVFSTLVFLEKLVWWSSRHGEQSVPFIVCNDPAISRQLPVHSPPLVNGKGARTFLDHDRIIENLTCKRTFLEQSGARCIVMPCHISHAWYKEVSRDCSVPFLHVGDCVARELKEAKLKPLEAGSNVRIGVLAKDTNLVSGFYREALQNQGFDVVLPDKPTMEHTVIPAVEALKHKDIEGARNLLRIAVQVLLVRGVNTIILASDEFQGLLPWDDPLLKKCIDPMDALARSTIRWAQSTERKIKALE